MRRRTFFVGSFAAFIATLTSTISRAQVWSLITREEFDRETSEASKGNFAVPPATAATPGEPKIDIKQPDPTKIVKVPVSIVITFVPEPDAKIVLSSFRAVYGTFIKLDITETIKAHAKLDEAGLFAEGVSLPTGKHNVTISIADNRGRVASRAVEFTVA